MTSPSGLGPTAPTAGASVTLRPVSPAHVHITDGLWHERMEVNRTASVPAGLEQLRRAKNLLNFEIAAGLAEGEPAGPVFADSDVYKWLEAAAWEYGRTGDEELLRAQLEISALVASAQHDDGYLNTVVPARHDKRYEDLPWSHEHYCAGHLIQAAVAQHRTTGRTELLDVAEKVADHLVATFGPGKTEDVDGHPIIETALVELFRETGTSAYLELAQWFVEARGHGIIEAHGHAPTYFSDRVPVREAETVEGHAVRAVYLAAGAADVAVETGDVELLSALGRQYAAMVRAKQYVTGGLGARWEGEAFGDPFELPNDRAYAETCAAIGGVQWAWRMLLATGEAVYADQIELMLLGGFLSGLSLSGTEYFYVNPLQLRHDAHPDGDRSPANGRLGWFDCACCPPNIMRTLSSLDGYIATTARDDASVQVHQYAAGTISAAGLRMRVETAYPWSGEVRIVVEEAPDAERTVELRVPAWAEGATLDGSPVAAGAYAGTTRTWEEGDALTLSLPMEPRLVAADERVDASRGCLAVMRGPLVYAFEAHDQPEGVIVDDIRIDPAGALRTEHRPELLGGATVVIAQGFRGTPPPADATTPYRAPGDIPLGEPVELTAIPYHLWANRGPAGMRVWVPRSDR